MLAESQTREQKVHKPFFRTKTDPKPAFSASILHHQNNSFDEFDERGYARAHCEDAPL
jgi:hypothetical protein